MFAEDDMGRSLHTLFYFCPQRSPSKKYFSSRIFRNPLYEIILVVSKPGFVRMNTKNISKKIVVDFGQSTLM